MSSEREWGMEREEKGKSRITKLMNILLTENRFDDAKRATEDKTYCHKLLKEFKLDI